MPALGPVPGVNCRESMGSDLIIRNIYKGGKSVDRFAPKR